MLFGQSFTKQAADHLGQVEALRKVKGKGKKVFSRPPLQKQIRLQGGSKPYTIEVMVRKGLQARAHPKSRCMEWQLTFQEPKAQIVEEPKAHISVMLSTQNVSIANPIMQKLHACFGFHSGTKTCEQSTGGGKNVSLCHQLESNNPGPVGPSYGAGLPHSFQGGASSSARTSTMSVFRGTNEAFARGGNLLAGEGGSGACCLGRRVLLDPLPGAQDGRSDEAGVIGMRVSPYIVFPAHISLGMRVSPHTYH